MKKVKQFIIGSSFAVLLSGSSIALAATQNPSLYSNTISVASSTTETVTKPLVEKKVKIKKAASINRYQKKLNYKKKLEATKANQ